MEQTTKGTPATKKIWLHLTAGIMWSGVGIMLVAFAAAWLGVVHSWTVFLLVLAGLVLAAGIYLRRSSPIPKPYLAILYIGLGLSLFISSLLYYRQAFRTSRTSSSASPDHPF